MKMLHKVLALRTKNIGAKTVTRHNKALEVSCMEIFKQDLCYC